MNRFRTFLPAAGNLELHLLSPLDRMLPLYSRPDGAFEADIEAIPDALYRVRVGGKELPDPASRFQPFGVHGPSQIVDPLGFRWTDADWKGIGLENLVIYELHVGTFTPEGTFASAAERIPYLRALGITAIEIMPVADFPGHRGWGYDGVSVGAPARCYGKPDDLRAFVDAAHAAGLAVLLDFVCNHLGPAGNYLSQFAPAFFTERHSTPWGDAVNFDGAGSEPVRRFFVEMARRWIGEFHFDGLRFDATHAIYDESPCHILREIAQTLRDDFAGRRLLFIAEDNRNLPEIVHAEKEGWHLDAVWSDDFHHSLRRLLAGDHEGYFKDFSGTTRELAQIIRSGWRPKRQADLGLASRIFSIQNHDQVGNRAFGDRIHHQIDPAGYRAAIALLLAGPETPLLFMGQEWAAGTPFLYFTDHEPELGRRISEGRRTEFKDFSAFADRALLRNIPDPQAESSFLSSKLRWNEIAREPHAAVLRLHRALLEMRRREASLRLEGALETRAGEGSILLLRRSDASAQEIAVAVQLKGSGRIELPPGDWRPLLGTEEPRFCGDPMPPEVELSGERPFLRFRRPGAVIASAN